MDYDQSNDCTLLKIKEKLNQNKVKLWLTPYYSEKEEINENEMKDLAHSCSIQLSIPFEVCLESLYRLQKKALDNVRERSNYKCTGVASLKIRVPSEQGLGKIITISMELTKTGIDLKQSISREISVAVERLKIIFHGKILKDEDTLESQGVKHGLHIMAVILESGSSDLSKYESHIKLLDSMKEDVKLLAADEVDKNYLQVADQTGKLLKLPEKEKTALILAMTLHEKGRAAIKREDFALALVLLLEAEKEFGYCNSSLLKSVDNYGLLNLDIVWCYLNLQSVTQLPDAEQRLKQCEMSFQQSYGPNMERLIALKGSAGSEKALFMRLHLLQAIVLYHKNKFNEARELFEKVEEELRCLEVDESQLSHLVELGYGVVEGRIALRESEGDLNAAINIIKHKHKERKKNKKVEEKQKKLQRKRKKLGKCINGDWIEPQFHEALMSMGYSYETAKWALAQSCNNICNGVNLILENPELVPESSQEITDDSVVQVCSLGFEPKIAKLALKKHKGDIDKAIEELLLNDEEDFHDLSSSSSGSEHNLPSTSERKQRKHDEAYSRVSEGISHFAEDHLDISLTAEKDFLQKYKELLSK